MSRSKFIIIIVVMVLLFALVIFINRDRITSFINSKQWEIVDSIATIYPNKYLGVAGCGDKILVIENDKVTAYTNSTASSYSESINIKDVVVDSNKDYCVIGETQGSKLFLFNEKGKVWEFDVNGEIQEVAVNKNGYVACIYSKSGYRALIKVINNNGEEVITNYLASTYAVDADISNDNKYLTIAEINVDGINLESSLKIVDIFNTKENEAKTVPMERNTLILDVEYDDKNELLVLEDSRIERIDSNYDKVLVKEYKAGEASHVTIGNENNAIIIEKEDTGIFSTKYVVRIYDNDLEEKEYELDTSSKAIFAQGKTICIDVGNELLFLNTNGKLTKRCKIDGQVRDVKLYNNGSMSAIVFKDRVEIVKL